MWHPLSLPALTGHECPPCRRRLPSSALPRAPAAGFRPPSSYLTPAHASSPHLHACRRPAPARDPCSPALIDPTSPRATPLGPYRPARAPPSSGRADDAELRRGSCTDSGGVGAAVQGYRPRMEVAQKRLPRAQDGGAATRRWGAERAVSSPASCAARAGQRPRASPAPVSRTARRGPRGPRPRQPHRRDVLPAWWPRLLAATAAAPTASRRCWPPATARPCCMTSSCSSPSSPPTSSRSSPSSPQRPQPRPRCRQPLRLLLRHLRAGGRHRAGDQHTRLAPHRATAADGTLP